MSYPFLPADKTGQQSIVKSIFLLFGFWLAGQVIAFIALQPFLFLMANNAGSSAVSQVLIIFVALIIGSGSMALLAIYWTLRVEERSLASIGLTFDATSWRQYRAGISTGFLFALALILIAVLIGFIIGLTGEASGAEETQIYWQNLADPSLWVLLGALFIAFIVQGGAEEIVCRGWLLTDICAKVGLPKGIIISALLFASLHMHLFFINGLQISLNQVIIGLVGLSAMLAMGLMLAMIAMRDRSIMGACGLHSGFNFFVLASGIVFLRLSSDQESISAAMLKMFAQSTSLSEVGPALVAQILLSFAVAWVLLKRFGLPRPSL